MHALGANPHTLFTQVSGDDIEAEFWRVVESGQEAVEVLCGAGLDTGTIGSGFPQVGLLVRSASALCSPRCT